MANNRRANKSATEDGWGSISGLFEPYVLFQNDGLILEYNRRFANLADQIGIHIKKIRYLSALALHSPVFDISTLDNGNIFKIAGTTWVKRFVRSHDNGLSILMLVDVSDLIAQEHRQDTAHGKAQEALRMKQVFLATMNHELRTPLNAIIGFSEVLSAMPPETLKGQRVMEYGQFIQRSGRQLLSIVNDILELSRIESGDYRLKENSFSLSTVISTIIHSFKSASPDVHIDFSSNNLHSTCLKGDEHLFRQCILKLLSNSAKFAGPTPKVAVSMSRRRGWFIISVENNGPPIPISKMRQLFEPFAQAGASAHHASDGTGLGLPLIKRFMILHGGDCLVENRKDGGVQASLLFPTSRILSP